MIVINADKVQLTGSKRDRQELLLAHRLSRRHQGAHRGADPRGPHPERVVEKAVERMMPRGPLGRQQMNNLRSMPAPSIRMRRSSPSRSTSRAHEPQEQEERSDMADTTIKIARRPRRRGGRPACRTPRTRSRVYAQKLDPRRAGPRLCHRQAQGRRRPRLDQARHRPDHRQRQGDERVFRPPGAADDHRPAVQVAANGDGQYDVIAPSPAAACPARPARCATASRKALTSTSRICARR